MRIELLFTDEELQALVAYLSTLGEPVSYSDEAPTLYTQFCSSCHVLNGEGNNIGPDLTNVGDRRDLNFLQAFTSDPGSVLPGSSMPSFKDQLRPEQVHDIAAYLFNQKSDVVETVIPPPTTSTGEPPLVPHEYCVACHGHGIKPFPSDHIGRTNDQCFSCHKTLSNN